jgi:hypothetical protein
MLFRQRFAPESFEMVDRSNRDDSELRIVDERRTCRFGFNGGLVE